MRPFALCLLVVIVAAVRSAETQSTPQIERIDPGAGHITQAV